MNSTTISTVNVVNWSSPIGDLRLSATAESLVGLEFLGSEVARRAAECPTDVHFGTAAVLSEALRQLEAYFAGRLRQFDLPLTLQGTPHQREVWQAVAQVEYGATTSYAEIARRLGRPRAVRAVGAANGRNPLPLLIPCHRIVGSDGSLTGYRGGLAIKRWLLQHEARHARQSMRHLAR